MANFLDRLMGVSSVDQAIKQIIFRYRNVKAPVVLDIGAGNGRYAAMVREILPGATIHCYDLLQKPDGFIASDTWHSCDAWNHKDFPNYDFCIISSALYYNKNWDSFLCFLVRELSKPSGITLISTIGTMGWHQFYRRARLALRFDHGHLENITKITFKQLEDLCANRAMKLSYICSFGGYLLRTSVAYKSPRCLAEFRYHNLFTISKLHNSKT